jgi:alpha-methylacyl-CoA racemase
VFDGRDACVAPVLTYAEAAEHPHLVARQTYVAPDGVVQPAPAPRFSRTPATIGRASAPAGYDTDDVLLEAGFTGDELAALRAAGTVA